MLVFVSLRTCTASGLKAWCAAQDPFTVIGQYVELDRRGMGHCPFGAHHSNGVDSHPSFRVYTPARPGGCCWHCYTLGLSGNVFNFLQQYHGLDAKTLWVRIQQGVIFE
jgi:DNA primase